MWDNTFLADIGINRNQSARCQKLAEMSGVELQEWIDSKYDESSYYLPSLYPASKGVHVTNNSGESELIMRDVMQIV